MRKKGRENTNWKLLEEWGYGSVCELSLKYENLSSDLRTYTKSQGVAQHPWKPCIGGCIGVTGRSPKNIGSPASSLTCKFIEKPYLRTIKAQNNKGKEPNLDSRHSHTCTPVCTSKYTECTHAKK